MESDVGSMLHGGGCWRGKAHTQCGGDLVEALRSETVVEPAKNLEVKYFSTQTVVEGGMYQPKQCLS